MPYKDLAVRKKVAREWRKKRRDLWVIANGPCWKCGSTENLELKWLGDGGRIRVPWSSTKERQQQVLKDYAVLCRTCRRAEHMIPQEKSNQIASLLLQGYGTRSIKTLIGIGRETVERIRRLIDLKNIRCGCGEMRAHAGRCWWRLNLDTLGFSEDVKEEIRQWNRAAVTLKNTKKALKTKLQFLA